MKKLALALCATIVFAAPAFAQSPDAAPAPAAAPADPGAGDAGAAPPAKGAGNSKMKELMQSCRATAKGQGLKGKDLRQAVMDCVVKEKPGMAGRLKCRMDAIDKGLKPGSDELKAAVKDCVKKG